MVIMEIKLINPMMEAERSSYNQDNENILNDHVQYLIDRMKTNENNDPNKLKTKLESVFPHSDIKIIDRPNSYDAICKVEEDLSNYEYAYLIAIPNISSDPCVVYCNKLDKEHNVPLFWCMPDYIDMLYCLYSYLII